MPELEQIQTYIRYRRKQIGDNNDLDQLASYVETLAYTKGFTEDCDLCVFGVDLGNGSDEAHFHLGFTTLELLKRINEFQNRGCFHEDATYKILKYSYPLIVFGFSDISRKFYPVSFMFTSHEETADFDHFHRSFISLCRKHDIDFNPQYIVTDASRAMARSIKKFLPESLHITCWFHLKKNIKKHKNLIPKNLYEETMQDITRLHMSTNELDFKTQLKLVNDKWDSHEMNKFKKYFNKQWVDSSFKNWQIYHSPPGYALTNNPLEQYNAVIKHSFTNRIKYNMQPAIEKFSEALMYESRKAFRMSFELNIF